MKLFKTKIKKYDPNTLLQPGQIHYRDDCLKVGTGNGIINIYEIQLEGKKRLSVSQFVAGLQKIKGGYFG